jgi:putative oxidoreductase
LADTYSGVRRLFSTFAHGWPGIGLILLRVAAGGALATRGLLAFPNAAPVGSELFQLVVAAVGLLLIIGLWTPAAAAFMAIFELWRMVSRRGDLTVEALLCTLALAIALLGPGGWSVDGRLFGWKRIDIETRKYKR